MPKFQGQIFHDPHSLSETFAPCTPKCLAPSAHAFLLQITPAHTPLLQGKMFFSVAECVPKKHGFLVNLLPALIWHSHGWLEF